MRGRSRRQGFLTNDDAISEEFTSLPGLSVVMIGFTLFIVLLANTYSAYYDRMDRLELYQTADLVATKLIQPNSVFIRTGAVDYPCIQAGVYDDDIIELRQQYQRSGVDFTIIVTAASYTHTFPVSAPTDMDRIAITRDVSVILNDAETVPGKLTVIMWKV